MLSEIPFFGTAKNSISLNRLKPITEKPLSNVPFVPLLRGFLHIYSLIPLFVLSEEFVIDAITKDK